MGFLDSLMKDEPNKCSNCGNLIRVRESLIGCKAHDKLIIPELPPYFGQLPCKDWIPREVKE